MFFIKVAVFCSRLFLAVVFHDDSKKASDQEIYESYVNYGKALSVLIGRIQDEIKGL